jgi:SAM-dependent methyltransferase
MKLNKLLAAGLAVVFSTVGLAGCAYAQFNTDPSRQPDVIFVPTPEPVVQAMLTLASVRAGEKVYDLGCGDGRVVISAARDFGAHGIGVDIDPQRIRESNANARKAGVTDRVKFVQEDLFEMDFSDADVVFLYLLQRLNVRLRPRLLEELRPGTRIVSHAFSMGDWKPDAELTVDGNRIYFWRIPARVAGEWRLQMPDGQSATLALTQVFQHVRGTVTIGNQRHQINEGTLDAWKLRILFGEGESRGEMTARIEGRELNGLLAHGNRRSPTDITGRLVAAQGSDDSAHVTSARND